MLVFFFHHCGEVLKPVLGPATINTVCFEFCILVVPIESSIGHHVCKEML